MLVLSRKLNEKVIVTLPDGRSLGVVVVALERGKVRLGFDGPPDVPIHREEIQLKIDAEAKRGG